MQRQRASDPLERAAPVAILAYHGTDAEFEEFGYTLDIGYHFGPIETAERRLLMVGDGEWPEGANVRPVLLDIRRPLRLPDLHDWNPRAVANALVDAGVVDPDEAEATDIIDQEAVAAWLERAGYDGIVYANQTELGGESWIALYPQQIRPWWQGSMARQGKTPGATPAPLPSLDTGGRVPAKTAR